MDLEEASVDAALETEPETETERRGRSRNLLAAAAMIVLIAGCGCGLWWWIRSSPQSSDRAGRTTSPGIGVQTIGTADAAEAASAELRRAVIGDWKLERDGQRLLSLQADGTASMNVTLTGWQTVLFGEKMRFDIRWSLDGRELVLETTGGEPATAVEAVTKVYGVVRRQPILEVNSEHMLLKDPDEGEADHDYIRVRIP
ncbi:MAG: hypothetical protein ABGZ17_14435 [Planctomycetaceae bacterium]